MEIKEDITNLEEVRDILYDVYSDKYTWYSSDNISVCKSLDNNKIIRVVVRFNINNNKYQSSSELILKDSYSYYNKRFLFIDYDERYYISDEDKETIEEYILELNNNLKKIKE